MTASATSSPVVLLSSPVDAAKAATLSTAKASGDTGGDGFHLLLAQVEEGIRASSGPALLLTGTGADNPQGEEPVVSDDGNDLPLLAGLLPLGQPAPATESTTGDTDKHSKQDSDETDATTDLSALQPADQTPVPLFVAAPVPAQLSTAAEAAGTAAKTAAASADLAVVMAKSEAASTRSATDAAQPAVASTQPAAAAGTPSATAATQSDVALMTAVSGSGLFVQTQKNDGAARTADGKVALRSADAVQISATPATPDIAASIVAGSEGSAARKTGDDADFDALVKQFEAPNPAAPAGNTGVDAGRTLPQANRPFAEISTGAATVSVPVGAQGWSDAVTDKVMWFSASKINSAEIHLNPPDLGPLQVRISTERDQTSVVFTSPHAAVRDALDQALPRLRDMLTSQGMQLLDVGVGGQGAARQQYSQGNAGGDARSPQRGFFSDMTDSAEPVAVTTVATARLSRSSIDAYA